MTPAGRDLPSPSLPSFSPLPLDLMSSEMFHIPAGHARESQDEDQGVLGGRATIGDDGPTEESNVHARDRDGRAGQVDGRTEEHRRAGRTGEGDETMELQLRAEGDGRGKEGDGLVQDGVTLFMIDGAWRQVPCKHWAWTPLPQRTTYPRCTYPCDSPFDCSVRWHGKVDWEYEYSDWIPKVRRPFKLDCLLFG